MFFKNIADFKNDKVNFKIIPEINEKFNSVVYGCIKFIDSYRFFSSILSSTKY